MDIIRDYSSTSVTEADSLSQTESLQIWVVLLAGCTGDLSPPCVCVCACVVYVTCMCMHVCV